eukprot:6459716-Karenia_brevis.AAC.1
MIVRVFTANRAGTPLRGSSAAHPAVFRGSPAAARRMATICLGASRGRQGGRKQTTEVRTPSGLRKLQLCLGN